MIVVVVMLLAVVYIMSRQSKKQRERQAEMQKNLAKGAKVTTIGGLHAVVDSVNEAEKTVDLDAEGVILTFDINALRKIESGATPAATTEEKPADKPEENDKP